MATIIASILVGLVAILHVYSLILEMFLRDKAFGLSTIINNCKINSLVNRHGVRTQQGIYPIGQRNLILDSFSQVYYQ